MAQESSKPTQPAIYQGAADHGHADASRRPAADNLDPLPLDRHSPQFTLRAVLTGMVLGALLSACNIYVGLKAGQVFSMSLTAALLGYGVWGGLAAVSGGRIRGWGILENNINQTACSSGAAVASAGLVAPIPALTMLTGQTLEWHWLALWVFSVMLVGIAVAVPLRRQMVVVERLPFPAGIASAELLRELHARGREALTRVMALVSAGVVAVLLTLYTTLKDLTPYALPFSIKGLSARALTFTLNPSLVLVAIGGLIGFRTCCSLLAGAILAYAIIAPSLVDSGFITVAQGQSPGFRDFNAWLLWPGVTLMVVASLVSVCLSWRSVLAVLPRWRKTSEATVATDQGEVPRRWFVAGLIGVLILSVVLQVSLFGIFWLVALVGVLLTFALSLVAARVSGETGLTPVGAMGKVTQLVFGALVPKNPVPNLMAANVTGGAASQCADLLHDLKCGHLLGASPRLQTLAQLCGALAGALAGSAVYLILIPNPSEMLGTEEWLAPAALVWKAVAELFVVGFDSLPKGTPTAMAWAAAAGILLPILERVGPRPVRSLLPSPVSMGLAFVYPANLVIPIFAGGLTALLLRRWLKDWSTRFLIAICVGVIAGESLTGLGIALHGALTR